MNTYQQIIVLCVFLKIAGKIMILKTLKFKSNRSNYLNNYYTWNHWYDNWLRHTSQSSYIYIDDLPLCIRSRFSVIPYTHIETSESNCPLCRVQK